MALVAAISLAAVLTGCLNSDQQDVMDRVNHSRSLRSLTTLSNHSLAQKKAQAWAEKMAKAGKISHSNLSDGMGKPGVDWCGIGENVGTGPNVRSIHTAYMNSPGHYANIVNKGWTAMGVGYAKKGNQVYTVHVFVKECK